MTAVPHDVEVAVVGAGPVGLSAALALRHAGVPVRVLEAGRADRTRPGSRAIYLHRQTLEAWGALWPGLGWEVAGRGIVWSTKRTFWRGDLVFKKSYPAGDPSAMPPFTSLAQVETERLLFDACTAAGAEFTWEFEVDRAASDPEGVGLWATNGSHVRARYVIAADGARSAVREAFGIAMSGSRSENHFVIVDVSEDPEQPLAPARDFHYEHPAVERRNVLLVPFAGAWRADLQCRPTDDPDQFNDDDGVRRWIGQVMPERYAERVQWVSTYQFLQVVADRFVDEHRRVLLVGEAAHLFAPFGARGLNSGVPDSIAAARAVGEAMSARDSGAAANAVDEFATSRRAAACYNRDAASTALRHMQARGLGIRMRRWRAARRALRGDRDAGAWLDSAPYGPRARDRQVDAIY